MPAPLHTDTAAQQAVGQEIGDIATAQKGTIHAFLDEVQALQASLQGSTGQATQVKAQHLNEVGIALMNEFTSISERVGVAAGGYINTDESGASGVGASAGQAF